MSMSYVSILLICLLSLNILTFIIYGIDKWKARKGRWRIPESSLLLLAACGGSIGAWCGMRVWGTTRPFTRSSSMAFRSSSSCSWS